MLDTNILIYSCKPGGEWLSQWTNDPDAAIASVNRIEELGFGGIAPQEEQAIRRPIAAVLCYPLEEEVIERAIHLRQHKKMRTADAMIAATALEFDLPLAWREPVERLTRNDDDFKHVAGLKLINPFTSKS